MKSVDLKSALQKACVIGLSSLGVVLSVGSAAWSAQARNATESNSTESNALSVAARVNSDFFGYASNATNAYHLKTSSGQTLISMQQNEVQSVLLQEEHAVIQDIFRRISWFGVDGSTRVSQVPGAQFRVNHSILGVITPDSFAKVYDQTGKVIWSTQRPVKGLGIAQTRFASIDRWRSQFELMDLQARVQFTRQFVKEAAISEGFVYLKRESGAQELFGAGFKQFAIEVPESIQISDDLAVIRTRDGRVRVYSPDRALFTRSQIDKVVLTPSYLALSDRAGLEIFSTKGEFLGRHLISGRVHYTTTGIAIHQSTGSVRLLGVSTPQAGTASVQMALIPRAERVVVSPRYVMALNGYFFDLYSFSGSGFGKRLYTGSRAIDAGAQVSLGLTGFGFVNPNARSGQVIQLQANDEASMPVSTQSLLDEMFISRIDLSTEAPQLNWTIF